LKRIKVAAWVITLLLWLTEVGECTTSMRGIRPALDELLDSLTVVMSFIVVAWTCTEHVVRAMEHKASALATFIDATSARALPVDPRDSGPHPRPRLVEDRDSA
jgi:hypothetical protein